MFESPAAGNAPAPAERQDARDLQAQLYREIGISAVAAALRFINQPDPTKVPAGSERPLPNRTLAA